MTDIKFIPPKGSISLEVEITVIVPSTKGIKAQKVIGNKEMKERVDTVKRYLSNMFGGYTSIKAVGGYTMNKGKHIVQEDVVKVTTFGDDKAFMANKSKLIKKIQYWCKDFRQESMGLIIETDFFIIKRG